MLFKRTLTMEMFCQKSVFGIYRCWLSMPWRRRQGLCSNKFEDQTKLWDLTNSIESLVFSFYPKEFHRTIQKHALYPSLHFSSRVRRQA